MLKFIRGVHKFEIMGISPERFINISNRRRLHIFNIYCERNRMFGYINASEFRTLADAAEKSGVQLKIVASYGLPYLVKNYRRRIGFVLGFGVFCFCLWYLSLFVWFVDTVNLPEQYSVSATDALYDAGIRPGVLSSSVNGAMLELELEEKLTDFDFIKISRLGCNAQVYFYPSRAEKSKVESGEPCDTVASSGGEIVSIVAKSGTPMVAPGDVVYPGDVLISGLFEGQEGSISMVHSYGEVQAITEYTLSEAVELRQTVKEPTGKVITINRLLAFGMEIPLFSSIPKGNYSRAYKEYHAELFGFKLPLVLRREYWSELCYIEKELSRDECVTQGEKTLDNRLNKLGGIEVIANNRTVNETNGGIRVTYYVTLLENIAEERKILFN